VLSVSALELENSRIAYSLDAKYRRELLLPGREPGRRATYGDVWLAPAAVGVGSPDFVVSDLLDVVQARVQQLLKPHLEANPVTSPSQTVAPAPQTPPRAQGSTAITDIFLGRGGPAPERQAAPPPWWHAILGTWEGTSGGADAKTIVIELGLSGANLAATLKSSDGLGAETRVRIVSGSRETLAPSTSQVHFDGRLSDDGKTIAGQLTVWFWTPKTIPLTLTKR
jgi:hypothetical protein